MTGFWEWFFGIVTVLGTLVTMIGVGLAIRWRPTKRNERTSNRKAVIRRISFWRPSHFSLAMLYLNEYLERLRKGSKPPAPTTASPNGATAEPRYFNSAFGAPPTSVSKQLLHDWAIEQALTAAAYVVPESLGKAVLFRVAEASELDNGDPSAVPYRHIRLYAADFHGIFPPHQLTVRNHPSFIRTIEAREDQLNGEVAAALQCVMGYSAEGRAEPIIQSLSNRADSEPERELGATHVLGIPIAQNFGQLQRKYQLASVTVELNMGWLYSKYFNVRYLRRDRFHRTTLYSRAKMLADLLFQLSEYDEPHDVAEPLAAVADTDASTKDSMAEPPVAAEPVVQNPDDTADPATADEP